MQTKMKIKVPEEVRARAREIHNKLRHKPGLEELFTPEEWANRSPMYFGLQAGIFQLKKTRERLGLTLAQVAEKTGLAEETLSRLETGATVNPTWQTLAKYAVAVGCKLSLLVKTDRVT